MKKPGVFSRSSVLETRYLFQTGIQDLDMICNHGTLVEINLKLIFKHTDQFNEATVRQDKRRTIIKTQNYRNKGGFDDHAMY